MSFTASLTETWENEIAAKLTTDLGTAILTEVMPEKVADFKRAVTNKSIVSVCYHDANYVQPKSTAQIVQDTTETFEITVRAKFRRGENGIWDLRQQIQKSLVGFSPTSCDKLYLKSFSFKNFEENEWTYCLQFSCASMIIEDYKEPVAVLITEIKATVSSPQ